MADKNPDPGVIVDDTRFDHGTRFRPDRNTPITAFLGNQNANWSLIQGEEEKLDKALPPIDPDNLVVPPANIPLEVLVQKLVDKAFSEKEKAELTEEEVGLKPVTPDKDDVAEMLKKDAADAKKANEPANSAGKKA